MEFLTKLSADYDKDCEDEESLLGGTVLVEAKYQVYAYTYLNNEKSDDITNISFRMTNCWAKCTEFSIRQTEERLSVRRRTLGTASSR